MFQWIHHSGNKTLTTMKTFSTLKLQKKKAVKNALKKTTDDEPTPCCGKQGQRVVRLVKKIIKSNRSTKRKQSARKKGITALEKFNFLCNKFTMYDTMKTYKSEAMKRRLPSEKIEYFTRKQASARISKDIHNLEHHDDLTSKVPAYNKKSAYHSHLQATLEFLSDKENLEHRSDLSSVVPPNEIIIANAKLQYTSKHISDNSYLEQLLSVYTEYEDFKEYLSDMESESDIKDDEDYNRKQQNHSKLVQREATALGVFDDFIEKTQVLSNLNLNYADLESDKYVEKSSIQLDEGTASALTALYESESESDTSVTKIHSSINGTFIKNGIPFLQSTFVVKRNAKSKQEVKFFLFGNNCNQLYTRSAALSKFQNNEISTKDFKVMRLLRRNFDDIIEVFETQEPHRVKINDLIHILKQFESNTSQQLDATHATVPLQPSVLSDSKLGSSSSLPVDKWTDKVVSRATKNSEKAELNSFAGNKTESLGNTIDKANTPMLKEATRICETPPETETSENRPSTKELDLDSDIRKSISKSENVSSTHRTTDPMLTSRRKMVDAKVKKTSTYKTPKINIFTTLDDDETGISTVLKEDIVRQAMYGWFNNEPKIQFQRPSIPWPSMHPLLPYKLRYLDEGLVDNPVVKTTSSPNDSTDENE